MTGIIFSYDTFWAFVRSSLGSISAFWEWINTPFLEMPLLSWLPDGFLEIYDSIIPVSWVTPLAAFTVAGLSAVLVMRLIHLFNPVS